MPYLAGVGRTPRVMILGKVMGGPTKEEVTHLLIQERREEICDGKYVEGPPWSEAYFVPERGVYAKLTVSRDNPCRYTLQGAPDLTHVRVIESEAAYWEEEAKQKERERRDKWKHG